MKKVIWTEHKTKEEVLETIGEERSLICTIKTRQKTWIGHTLRGESLLKMVTKGKRLEKGSRGRRRQMMLDWMILERYKKLKEEVQQCEEWRHQTFEPALKAENQKKNYLTTKLRIKQTHAKPSSKKAIAIDQRFSTSGSRTTSGTPP